MTSPEERPPSAVLGRIPATPRWKPGRDKNNEAAMMLHAGRVDEAAALLGEVVALTRVADVDGEGLDMRARALQIGRAHV